MEILQNPPDCFVKVHGTASTKDGNGVMQVTIPSTAGINAVTVGDLQVFYQQGGNNITIPASKLSLKAKDQDGKFVPVSTVNLNSTGATSFLIILNMGPGFIQNAVMPVQVNR